MLSSGSARLAGFVIAALALPALAGCTGTGSDAALQAAVGDGQLREFDMYVSESATYSPLKGVVLPAFAFSMNPDGPWTVPGPEIRVTQGDHLRVRLHDNGDGHTIHWHGVNLPWAMDGVPFMTQNITSDGPQGTPHTYTYDFVAREAGTYWYHCHVDAPAHVDAGLFGAFIVEPRNKAEDPPFDRESTLLLHETDRTYFAALGLLPGFTGTGGEDAKNVPANPVDAARAVANSGRTLGDVAGLIVGGPAGEASGSATPRDYYPAPSLRYRPQYDTFMINGKSFPETKPVMTKTGDVVRLRVVNAGQLVHTVHLHGHHFTVTHKDGYLLPEGARYAADTLLLGPGERYDLYVKSNNPGTWDLHDHGGAWDVGAYAANDHAFPGGMNTMLVYEDFKYAQLPGVATEHVSGDYQPFLPSFQGRAPPDRLHLDP